MNPRTLPLVATLLVCASAGGATMAVASRDHHDRQAQPLIIGHRGAAGYRPEHTLASYELAARMGADSIEPDLVPTKDGVLVARHEPEIGGTTDVAAHAEFADRRTTKVIDGQSITGWFTEDFTLAELKTLRAKERLPAVRQENTIYDGRFEIPTFQEVLDLRERLSEQLGREIGVYPETKHPTYFAAGGHDLTPLLVRALRAHGLDRKGAPVFVQSFESGNLRKLHQLLPRTPLVRLLGGNDRVDAAALRDYASFADGIGPDKTMILPRDAAGRSLAPTTLVADAHAAGLLVHPYTFRAENQFLPLERRSSADPNAYGDVIGEIQQFLRIGVDGLFTDNADIGVEARRALQE